MWVRNNKGNVFVGNLPPNFPDERLAEAFDPFGIVLSAVVARDPDTGARLRYGFVDIATDRAATKAIAALHGSEVDGCKLNVKPREKPVKKPGGAPRRPPPPRAMRLTGPAPRDFDEAPPPSPRRLLPQVADDAAAAARPAPIPLSQSEMASRKLAQTQRDIDAMPEIEPPPRRDFEVVRRPVRRLTGAAPSFQVERRPLPRRSP